MWDVETQSAHWYGPALLPQRFEARWDAKTLTLDTLQFSIVESTDRSVFAVAADKSSVSMNLTDGSGTWTFSGGAGQASGVLKRR